MVQAAIGRVQELLQKTLGEDLISLYRYGGIDTPDYRPERSDLYLLAVVADDIDLHRLRAEFLPVWAEPEAPGPAPCRPPLLIPHAALSRHLLFFPLFAHHLATYGERLAGAAIDVGELEAPGVAERAAYLAHQAMLASSVMVPELLSPQEAEAASARLRKVARHLTGAPLPEATPVAELFALVQQGLRELLESVPGQATVAVVQTVEAPAEPELEAIYSETDHTVCLIPELSADRLRQVEWDRLAGHLQPHHASIQVTTASQLLLIVRSEAALEFALGRYEHAWGSDPLDGFEVSTQALWRNAGRVPSRLLVDDVPGAYLTTGDEEALHKVVHDYQNGLLNMRLRHELLYRLHGFEAAVPPEPLPGRDQPLPVRIDAILDQLEWWAAYYLRQIQAAEMSEKITAP